MNKKCKQLGCTGVAIQGGYCSSHYRGPVSTDDMLHGGTRVRPDYHSLYNTRAWKRLRRSVMSDEPCCQRCLGNAIIKITTDIDHIVPHRGDHSLFYDRSNLQGLCHECHSWKTAREQGASGPMDFRVTDK